MEICRPLPHQRREWCLFLCTYSACFSSFCGLARMPMRFDSLPSKNMDGWCTNSTPTSYGLENGAVVDVTVSFMLLTSSILSFSPTELQSDGVSVGTWCQEIFHVVRLSCLVSTRKARRNYDLPRNAVYFGLYQEVYSQGLEY